MFIDCRYMVKTIGLYLKGKLKKKKTLSLPNEAGPLLQEKKLS